jgi:hypothetical protein
MKRSTVFFVAFFIIIVPAMAGCAPSPTPIATSEEVPTPTPAPPTATAAPPTPTIAPSTPIPVSQGANIPVWSTSDSGLGTLRQALLDAQSYDTITFETDVFKRDEPATITVTSTLQITQGHLTIDASNAGVILDGSELPRDTGIPGLEIVSDGNVIRGLQVINFPGPGIVAVGCHTNTIGGDRSTGSGPIGQGNLISSNGVFGIGMHNASNNVIKGNYIGTDPGGSQKWGNQCEGIYIEEGSCNEISQNLICDSGASGITLHGIGSHSNIVSGNLIGVGANQSLLMGNHNNGVEIRHSAHNNQVGPDNIIANMNGVFSAIQIYGSDSIENTISQNSIYDSRWVGIDLWGGGNLELAPPIIIDFDLSAGTIRGLAYPNASMEVFSIDNNNRSVFEGQTHADSTGIFALQKGAFTGPRLTASATDVRGNTSEFSVLTDGTDGTASLQANRTLNPTRLVALQSVDLEDNHIASYWHSLWGYDPLSELLDEVRYLGVKRFRFTINGGDADKIDWSREEFSVDPSHDEFVDDLVDNDIRLTYMLNFWDIATWPDGRDIDTPCPRFKTEEEIQHYLDYVTFIVDHFKDRIRCYEIWNEPDNVDCPQWIEVADYINLVHRTVLVIRRLDPEAKIQVGGTAGLSNPESQDYFFKILESDIMPLVDVVSWHPFFGESPEQNPDYYYAYPGIVQEIKATASSHGFVGEYEADEMSWPPKSELEYEPNRPSYGEIAYAKYQARGILMNLGLDLTAGNPRIPHQWVVASNVMRNLSTIMAGNKPISLPVTIQSEATSVESYGFSLPSGDNLLALWDDGVALDYDAGVPSTLAIPGFAGWNAAAIDVLNGFEQELISSNQGGDLIIQDILIRDYPIIIRLSK